MNIEIYIGPKREFEKILPKENAITLVDLVSQSDEQRRTFKHKVDGQIEEEKTVLHFENLIAYSDDYSAITESALYSFIGFLFEFEIDNLYLQNPPEYIVEQIRKLNHVETNITKFECEILNIEKLRQIKNDINKKIIGQEIPLKKLIGALYPLAKGRTKKPSVILLYGPTGVGKTETAKYLSSSLGENIFRKQFSMFHSEDFASYLFGGKHSQNCFARELLERESNIILLDEFDKPNPIFHSAFYQLFDEGIFEDKNYKVEMKNSIIICTSNFKSDKDIREKLGDPIYSRFDAVIEFNKLNEEAIRIIVKRIYDKKFNELDDEEKEIIATKNVLSILNNNITIFNNVREIKRVVTELLTACVIDELL